ncbi:MAG: hypothetical protein AB8H80_19800 [Planctomycetota bacterium]
MSKYSQGDRCGGLFDDGLSDAAQRRRDDMLPGLLQQVRGRRRRRRAGQAAVAGIALGGAAAAVWALLLPLLEGGVTRPPSSAQPSAATGVTTPVHAAAPNKAAAFRCEVVRNRADVLARLAPQVELSRDWFLDDEGLHRLLQANQRPAGTVRIGARVWVSSEAVDSLPASPQSILE